MNLKELKTKLELDELELFCQETSSHDISFSANKLKQTEVDHRKGMAVRLLKDKKIGFAAMVGKNDIEDLATKALKLSSYSPDSNIKLPSNIKESELKVGEKFDASVLNEFKEKGEELIDYIQSEINSKALLVDASFNVGKTYESVENSNELKYETSDKTVSFGLSVRETLENDFVEIFTACADEKDIDYKKYVDEVIRFYKWAKKPAKVKNGSFPVLFTSRAAKDLLNIVEAALSGKQANQKSTPWHDKVGKKVLSDLVTLRQDPSFGHMARRIDDEGTNVQSLKLVENGTLNSFYYDLLTASNSTNGSKSTGNGFKASLATLPDPMLLNLIMEPGKKSFDEIIKGIEYGVLVDQTIGSLTTNISGDTSFNLDLGFLIENGEVVGRLKDTMVSGNIYTALNNVIEISNDPRWYWSSTYNPDLLLDSFNVTS